MVDKKLGIYLSNTSEWMTKWTKYYKNNNNKTNRFVFKNYCMCVYVNSDISKILFFYGHNRREDNRELEHQLFFFT